MNIKNNSDNSKRPMRLDGAGQDGCVSCQGGCCTSGCASASDSRCKLHATNWLADIPGGENDFDIVEVHFKNTRKGFYRNSAHLPLSVGDMVAVEANPGHDIGRVSMMGRLVKLQMKRANLRPDFEILRVFRKAKASDLEKFEEAKAKEVDTMIRSRKIAADLHLKMKIGDVEYQGDGNKAIFYYIADERVDFRQLIKVLAAPGVRTHRRHRPVRPSAVLRQLDDQLGVGGHERRPLPGHLAQPPETGRTVRQAQVLHQFRGRQLCGGHKEAPAARRDARNQGQHLFPL